MIGLVKRKDPCTDIPGLFPVQRGPALLGDHCGILSGIRSSIGVPTQHWRLLYQPLFTSFAEFVQQLPASEAHHHCDAGGLLRHGMQVVELALRLRRGHVLPPGKEPEQVAEEQEVWTYAVATAALLHDIGKPLIDQVVGLYGRDGLPMSVWSPWVGAMTQTVGKYYSINFARGRQYRLHQAVTPLLVGQLIPKDGLRWLGSHHDALAAWMTAIGGHAVGATVIAEIVKEADGLSVGRDLSGERRQLVSAQAKPLAERMMVELRQLLESGALPINRSGAAAFIDADSVWLVSKRCLDAIRESMKGHGQSGVPSRNDRLMDELQQRGMAVPTPEDRAIWTCEVCVGEGAEAWRQKLTLLRVPIDHLWPNPESRPAAVELRVSPIEEDMATSDSVPTPVSLDEPGNDEYDQEELADILDVVTDRDEARYESPEATPAHGDEILQTGEGDSDSEDLGAAFVAWLIRGLKSGSFAINTAKARAHVVEEGLFLVSPAIFRSFAGERWLNAQKRFLRLKMTAKTAGGENIFHYVVNGDRGKKVIKGMLIRRPQEKLSVRLPEPNSILSPKRDHD